MRRPPLHVVAVVALVLVAGCGAPFGSDGSATPAREPTDPPTTTGTAPPDGSPSDQTPTERPATSTAASTPTGTPTPTATPTATSTPTATPTPAPTATPTPTPTATPTPPTDRPGEGPAAVVGESQRVRVDGDLPVNATRIYRRVERLLNVSGPAPTVRVFESERIAPEARPDSVQRALGFGEAVGDFRQCGAFASARAGGDEVRIDARNLSAEGVELVLAHEFVHVLQDEVDGYENATGVRSRTPRLWMAEGSAVYVADAYARRYDKRWAGKRPLEIRECLYRQTENGVRLLSGQYYFGGRHFDQRIDSPSALSTVFDDPPRTTEQLIHGETPASEPAAPLSVTVSGLESGEWRQRPGGELLARTWLSLALEESRIDTAATGWGNDTVVVPYDSDEQTGVAWVLRWDSAADADEFERAVGALETDLEARNATQLGAERVGGETVVVFAGPASWVANATASGTSGNVTVSLS